MAARRCVLDATVEFLDAVDCTHGLPIEVRDDVIAGTVRCTMVERDCCVYGRSPESWSSCEQQSEDRASHEIAPSKVWLSPLNLHLVRIRSEGQCQDASS